MLNFKKNFMELAFAQSLLAVGVSRPNPAVGAIVVKKGRVVGFGHTQKPGGAHAEVMALKSAGKKAQGASIFVTLEPCCHYGRTPPCTKAIIEAGISKVYFAHSDPNPIVCGNSRKILENAGIIVYEGLDACSYNCNKDYANWLYAKINRFFEAYDYFVRNKATFVEIKSAISQNEFLGAVKKNGMRLPLKITGDIANSWNHELRSFSDALLVSASTLISDNPRLNVRLAKGNSPVKIVWAGHHLFTKLEIQNLHILSNENLTDIIIYSCVPQLYLTNIECVLLHFKTFAENFKQMRLDLYERGMHRLIIEPGAILATQIFKSKMWNRLYLWHSTDMHVEDILNNSDLFGIPYPELPSNIVAKESFIAGSDVLTVYENCEFL